MSRVFWERVCLQQRLRAVSLRSERPGAADQNTACAVERVETSKTTGPPAVVGGECEIPGDESADAKQQAEAASGRQALIELLQELQLAVDELQQKQRQSLEELQCCAIELAVSIARIVTGTAVQNGEFNVAGMVRQAIDTLNGGGPLTVLLNPLDLELLRREAGESLDNRFSDVTWQGSSDVQRGAYRLESAQASLISSWEYRMDDIRRIWLEELHNAQIERRSNAEAHRDLQRFPDRRETA